jgi:hypothetical protein
MTTLEIRFYEGSYQYKVLEVIEPASNADLFTGVLEELNHQYNYRPTVEDLWVIVLSTDTKEELFRIERIAADAVKVNYVADNLGKFLYENLVADTPSLATLFRI